MRFSLLHAAGAVLGCALAAAAAASDLAAHDAHVIAVPPGSANSAAFMVLRNSGAAAINLIGARADIAAAAELHATAQADGIARMRKIDSVRIPAGEEVELASGGMHIMLIGLKRDLVADDVFAIELLIEGGSSITVRAPLRPAHAAAHSH